MKKKKKTKVVKALEWLNFGIFPGHAVFCYNMKYDEIIKELNKKKGDLWAHAISRDRAFFSDTNWSTVCRELLNKETNEIKKFYYIVIPEEFNYSDYDYARLAHEVLHICQFYLPEVLKRQDEKEAEAYLHTHLMMQCLNIIKRNNGNN